MNDRNQFTWKWYDLYIKNYQLENTSSQNNLDSATQGISFLSPGSPQVYDEQVALGAHYLIGKSVWYQKISVPPPWKGFFVWTLPPPQEFPV